MTDHPPSSPPAVGQPDWDALARFIAGESPDAEAADVRRFLDSHPKGADLLSTLRRSMDRLALPPAPDLDVETALRRVHERMREPVVHPLPSRVATATTARARFAWRGALLRTAAAVVVVAVGARVWLSGRTERGGAAAPVSAAARVFTTAVGQRDSTLLPDGSRVILGPASELTIAGGYGTGRREVSLRGDAFFDVVHDAAHPFAVRAGDATIADIGTSFAVHTDPGDGVHVSVASGSVRLHATTSADSTGVELRAGDVGTVEQAGRATARRGGATPDDLAWTTGRLVFRDASLAKVRADLRRWYGFELVVTDPALASRHVTASFMGESSTQVARVIALAVGARHEVRGDTVLFRPALASDRSLK
jgi:transmembrane sensor